MFDRVSGCVLGIILSWVSLSAQDPRAPARTVFRSGVEHVSVDVVVTDKNDVLVTDLTEKDFVVRDGGKQQQISDFNRVVTPAVSRKVDLGALMPPASDVATNPKLQNGGRAFVFVIDDGAILPEDIVPLKRVMTAFLQSLSPDDQVAVTYIRRSDLSQGFTNDLTRLVRAVNYGPAVFGWGPDTRATRLTLVNVVSVLATSPETRRAIVYVSSGHQMCPVGHPNYLDLDCVTATGGYFTIPGLSDLFDRARRADVPIYALDPHGIVAPELGLSGKIEDQTPQHRATLDVAARQRQQFLRTIAENTDGLAFVNTANPAKWAHAIVADNDCYYLLGYSPSPYVADGKSHPIEVSVNRPGVKVRFRKTYVASPRKPVGELSAKLAAALSDGEPHSDLGLRAFVVPMSASVSPVQAVVVLDVSYPEASVEHHRTDDKLDVVVAAVSPDGDVMALAKRWYRVALGAAPDRTVTVSLDDVVQLPRAPFTLRIGVASHGLNAVGTIHLPADFRAPGAKDVDITPLIVGVAAGATELVGGPERIASIVPFQPTTERAFSASQQLRVFARAFSATLRPEIELALFQGTKRVRTIPMQISPSPVTAGALDCLATVPLKDLQSGVYSLILTTKLPGGRASTRGVGLQIK
jgi:VWFA-related protein